MERDLSCENIVKLYKENKNSVSLLEFRTGLNRDLIIDKLDEYDRIYNNEEFMQNPQKNDIVQAIYKYNEQTYEVIGNIEKKYSNSCKVKVTGGDPLPTELLGTIVVRMNSRLTVLERAADTDDFELEQMTTV